MVLYHRVAEMQVGSAVISTTWLPNTHGPCFPLFRTSARESIVDRIRLVKGLLSGKVASTSDVFPLAEEIRSAVRGSGAVFLRQSPANVGSTTLQ